MSKLDLIWTLESHNNELDGLKKELDILESEFEINELKELIKEMKSKKEEIEKERSDLSFSIKKGEQKFKEVNFKIGEIDKSLYGGKIQDIKELEYLNKEKEICKKEIDSIEIQVIRDMEEEEKSVKNKKELDSELEKLEESLSLILADSKKKKGFLEIEIKKIEGLIEDLSSKIDEKDIHLYQNIRRVKAKAIVEVENYICQGCNVRIPTYFGTDLKAKEKFVFCENCGRILYYIS